MELTLFLLVLFAAAWLVAAPLRAPREQGERDDEAAALEAARDDKLREIKEAELDLQTGKLSPADHEWVDRALRGEALALLRQLDAARRGPDAQEVR
jgi:hypothetical protein